MTRPASRCSPTARSTPCARSATSPTCARPSGSPPTAGLERARVAVAAPPATIGLGHTRWATHGRVTEENAHPHGDCADSVHIVLNGIVENHAELRRDLTADGHLFSSETDAEIVAHLIERNYDGDLTEAVRASFAEMRGHYAFVAMHAEHPDTLVAARQECPLIVGLGEGETFVASAIPAFLAETRTALGLKNGEIVTVDPDGRADHRRRRQARRSRRARGHLGRGGRREGRLRDLHAEGDPRAGGRGRRDDHRPPALARRGRPLRARALRRAHQPASAGS